VFVINSKSEAYGLYNNIAMKETSWYDFAKDFELSVQRVKPLKTIE
jgi:dTDP-4-dehydrorhamnose reductase